MELEHFGCGASFYLLKWFNGTVSVHFTSQLVYNVHEIIISRTAAKAPEYAHTDAAAVTDAKARNMPFKKFVHFGCCVPKDDCTTI